MAKKKRAAEVDEITLYGIAAPFQDKLCEWLDKKNIVVDVAAGDDGVFHLTMDPGGEITSDSLEVALNEAMRSRARAGRIDRELEQKIHAFLLATSAHMTFGAAKNVFNVALSNDDAHGAASDEDLEFALCIAEQQFWEHMPENPLAPADRAALAGALMHSPIERAEADEEQLRRALLEPRPELEANRRVKYADWVADVDEELTAIGGRFDDVDPSYWRQLYQAGFDASSAVQEYGTTRLEMNGHPMRSVSRFQRPQTFGQVPPPPPSRIDTQARIERMIREEEKPFDPATPRERGTKKHHFAVNAIGASGLAGIYRDWLYSAWLAYKKIAEQHGLRRSETNLQSPDQIPLVWKNAYVEGLDPVTAARTIWDMRGLVNNNAAQPSLEANSRPYEQIARGMESGYGAWRIRIAGGDIDPRPFKSFDAATTIARSKYGDSGWDVEWFASSTDT